jgi:osmotically-inducible protein OsmY
VGFFKRFEGSVAMIRKPVRTLWLVVEVTVALSACVQTGPTHTMPASRQQNGGDNESQADSRLATAVRQALAQAPGFNVAGVFVSAHDGAVFLTGTVHTGDEILQANRIAQTVPGVLVVSNKLTLWHGGNR